MSHVKIADTGKSAQHWSINGNQASVDSVIPSKIYL